MYSISFTVIRKKFCFSLHYNGASNYLFVNGKEMIKFNTKDSEIVATPLCLGNISGQYIIWKKLDQMGMFMILLLIKYDHKLLM